MDWHEFRNAFPVTEKWAYFDHAAVAPIPDRTALRIAAWATDSAQNGIINEGAWWDEIKEARQSAAELINAKTDGIAFVPNTSAGISLIAEGFPWNTGDNLVIAEGEYPANVYPWLHLRERGVEVRQVPQRGFRVDPDDLVDAMDDKTRLLSLSHVQFATGFRSDLVRLGTECWKRGVDFCVDAIQSMGVLPIDVEAMRIDYLAADGHKWLLGPEGAGVFYIRPEKIDKIRPTSVGWKSVISALNFSTIDFQFKPNAERFEPGTFNVPGILGLGVSMKMLAGIGVDRMAERLKVLTDQLIDRLSAIGAIVASPRDYEDWSGIVSFSIPDRDPTDWARQARKHGVVMSARGGRLRVSPHGYTNADDMDRLVEFFRAV